MRNPSWRISESTSSGPVGDDAAVTDYPDRFPHIISPFYEKTLTVSGMREHHTQLLDIQNALITMSEDGAIEGIRDKGLRVYSWGIHDKYLSREKTLLPALPRKF
ncbi:MAG TPA: hypothetical protein VNR65_11195 [Geobacterales bacterium]|nr:hypothetical protein [Geobacterales bacterium]